MLEHSTKVKDTINSYGKKSVFASFLPGIAGTKGIPIWCYYVNRGQGVASFGVNNKDNHIMEFYPAHTSYQLVKRTGFRTFLKIDGSYFEPFKEELDSDTMNIYMNGLSLVQKSEDKKVTTSVDYTALPGEEIGALLRVVTIKNDADTKRHFEVVDGMPALVPYGVDQNSLKMMAQTTKAWMQVEDVDKKVPYYRVRVSMNDSAEVQKVNGGNFAFAVDESADKLPVIADPNVVFDYDLSLEKAVGFIDGGAEGLLNAEQNSSNEFPSCFFVKSADLEAGAELTLYEIIGQVRNKEVLAKFLDKKIDRKYFEAKFKEADELTDKLTDTVATKTANPVFDDYTRVNFMDNVLRGGSPMDLAGHVYYVYSRKHGDLERDYNYFSMSPEFYSQGNGNFRDVNQNRRCDTFFSDIVGTRNIEMFYSLLQLDGYNPLGIEQIRYKADPELIKDIDIKEPFTPGELYAALVDGGAADADKTFEFIMSSATETVNGNFGEGYWSDHWDYNLDLIEDYLEIYPDREKELFFDTTVKSFDSKAEVLHRSDRYVKTDNGIRQYNFIKKRDTVKEGSYALSSAGKEIEMSLLAKILLISSVKFATIDVCGLGVEMDGGKPGWYDALNGMPGLFGSSMNETYELLRMVRFAKKEAEKYGEKISLPKEAAAFANKLLEIEKAFDASSADDAANLDNWNKRNDAREEYRDLVYKNLSGEFTDLSSGEIVAILSAFEDRLQKGVDKALEIGGGISPAYFTYDVDSYKEENGKIIPEHFSLVKVPDFLEGPVRSLKLDKSLDEKRALYKKVKESDLFDKELNMYKVNSSLQDASFELGRCRAFTPGWLENESIWLHMEYKYLLELIRSGLYPEFFEDFGKMAIPFLDKDTYGRSTLENSSFIASSKNPNKKIRGKGFVARLSGSTIEFISMWKLIFFGKNVFGLDGEALTFNIKPAIPAYLIAEKDGKFTASATLLGHIPVTYEFNKKADFYPGNYSISEITVTYTDDTTKTFAGGLIRGVDAKDIRNGKVSALTVSLVQ